MKPPPRRDVTIPTAEGKITPRHERRWLLTIPRLPREDTRERRT